MVLPITFLRITGDFVCYSDFLYENQGRHEIFQVLTDILYSQMPL